jgi:hypothetical protein
MDENSTKNASSEKIDVRGPSKDGIVAAHEHHLPIVLKTGACEITVIITKINQDELPNMIISGIIVGKGTGRCHVSYNCETKTGQLERAS